MKDNNEKNISKNIKKYRLLNKMTQEKLAMALDMDTQYYAQLERGERNFTIEKIIKICSLLNIRIEDIIEVPRADEADTSQLLEDIYVQMQGLSMIQLSTVQKFIMEIVPYIR